MAEEVESECEREAEEEEGKKSFEAWTKEERERFERGVRDGEASQRLGRFHVLAAFYHLSQLSFELHRKGRGVDEGGRAELVFHQHVD